MLRNRGPMPQEHADIPARELQPERLGDHLDRLYRAAWALCGSPHDAEDLVQDTFARVLARPRLLRREDDLAYLLRALRNTFLSHRRTASRRPVTAPEEEGERPGTRSAPAADEVASVREVYGAISRLPEEFREALVAVDVAGLSYKEASKALKVPEGTVTSRVFRARARLAKDLK
jgi:RNA polymerase sigma-70 factor (ECF subfamily)